MVSVVRNGSKNLGKGSFLHVISLLQEQNPNGFYFLGAAQICWLRLPTWKKKRLRVQGATNFCGISIRASMRRSGY